MSRTTDADISRLLDAWTPPPLPAGFAAAVVDRASAAPPPAHAPRRRPRGWPRLPRLVGGSAAVMLLGATAAAAAGVFGDVGITIPAWQRTVEQATGLHLAAPQAAAPVDGSSAPPTDMAEAQPSPRDILADRQIDSVEEFDRRVAAADALREQNRAARRERADARLEAMLADRRARGLPVPDEAAIERMQARREARMTRREAAADARRAQLQHDIRARLDAGETVDLDEVRGRDGLTRAERRQSWLDSLPPARRERLEQWRARRDGSAQSGLAAPDTAVPASAADAIPSG